MVAGFRCNERFVSTIYESTARIGCALPVLAASVYLAGTCLVPIAGPLAAFPSISRPLLPTGIAATARSISVISSSTAVFVSGFLIHRGYPFFYFEPGGSRFCHIPALKIPA